MTTAAIKGRPPQTQSVFRGVSIADATRQAEADVLLARANGYDVESQLWTDDRGTPVLTVVYRFTGQVPKAAVAPPEASRAARPWAVLAMAAGVLVSLGAFLPWISASGGFVSISRNGVDGGGDGLLFAGGGLLLILLGVAAYAGTRGASKLIMLLGVVGLLGTYFEYQSIQTRVEDAAANVVVSIGLGIWAIGAGSLLALVAGVQVDENS